MYFLHLHLDITVKITVAFLGLIRYNIRTNFP
jgi:hypothetical protein